MSQSAILAQMERFRRKLYAHDAQALNAMQKAYSGALRELLPKYELLTAQALEAGPDATWGLLWRRQRTADLIAQISGILRQLGADSGEITRGSKRAVMDMALTQAKAMTAKAIGGDEALVSATFNRVPDEALRNVVGLLADGTPLDYKFQAMAADTVAGVKQTIISGVTQGHNPRTIAAALKRHYAGQLVNALTVCRTETIRAYRTASMESYRANDNIVKGWIWSAGHSPRTCAACWAMDGTYHGLDEELNDHPNGRCAMIPVTKTWKEVLGYDVPGASEPAKPYHPGANFEKLSETQQRQVLGKARYELYQNGTDLREFGAIRGGDVWGKQPVIRPLKELPQLSEDDLAD